MFDELRCNAVKIDKTMHSEADLQFLAMHLKHKLRFFTTTLFGV